MRTCSKCGEGLEEGQRFCRLCGAPADKAATGSIGAAPRAGVTENDLALFIGKNADKYLSRFEKFQGGGSESFTVTWHWPAFFFSFWWMLYRKMYGWAALALFLGCVPWVGFLFMVVFGMSGYYLYYCHVKRRVTEVRAAPGTDVDKAAALARAGGVNNVAVVVAPLLIVIVGGILAAIAIPQFAMYRQKSYDAKAQQQLLQACTLGVEFFAQDPARTQIEPEDMISGGLIHTADVELLLLDGRKEFFSISSRHNEGRKTYFTDRNCALSEEENSREGPSSP